jgi:hypothetical protein
MEAWPAQPPSIDPHKPPGRGCAQSVRDLPERLFSRAATDCGFLQFNPPLRALTRPSAFQFRTSQCNRLPYMGSLSCSRSGRRMVLDFPALRSKCECDECKAGLWTRCGFFISERHKTTAAQFVAQDWFGPIAAASCANFGAANASAGRRCLSFGLRTTPCPVRRRDTCRHCR